MLQYRFEMEKVLEVPPDAFRPAPQVDSAVVRMTPRSGEWRCASDEKMPSETVALAFSQRRNGRWFEYLTRKFPRGPQYLRC